MEWIRSRRLRTHAGNGHKGVLGGPEFLEIRQLLSATRADGMAAASWSHKLPELSGGTVTQFEWNGRAVAARADHWNGRLADSTNPLGSTVALPLEAPDWRAVSLGNGYFSLTTPGTSRADVLAWATHTAGIASFEPDFVLQGESFPNDSGFTSQWGLNNLAPDNYGLIGADIHATTAWDITTGSKSVVVAVIDSGIDLTHPDLAANIWTNPGEIAGNGIDDDSNGFVDDVHGWNFVDNSPNVQDGYGHGTHVSGIIGAVGNNGMGIAGINWSVSIMPLKFQDNFGLGYTGEAIAALNYATMMRRDHGINVVVTNNSWGGGTGLSGMLQEAIRAQGEAGITFVAAAGNGAADCDVSPRYPACLDLPNVISVAASDRYDNLAIFSNYGSSTIDLAAPGIGIYSTLPGGNYGYLSGTSQAAPQVSGVVAMLAAVKPAITVAEVRAAIFGSVDSVAGLVGKTVTGGRLNAEAALTSVISDSFSARIRVGPCQPLTDAIDSVTISFNRPVASGFDLTSLRLTRNGTTISLEGATLTTTDSITWTIRGLAPLTVAVGNYTLELSDSVALSDIAGPSGESLAIFSAANWTTANRLPIGAIETATPLVVRGWAVDPNAVSQPITVQLWVDGRLVGTVLAASPRDDLVPAYGNPNHGYSLAMPALPVGNHIVDVKAFDPETGLFVSLGQRVVAVQAPVGRLAIATARRLAGWAFSSRADAAPIQVRVVINGRVYGTFLASVARPDLAPRLGSTNHGYDISLNPAFFRRGRNTVQVYAIDPLSTLPTLIGASIVRR
ncbi:MAG: S8 family peptidase [Planctomycetia bacterium]